MQSLLPVWPPEKQNDGSPYPAEAKDEWRFRLAVTYALAGDSQAVTKTLSELLNHPVQPAGKWTKSAAQFQERYQNSAGLYLACVNAAYCDPQRALENSIASLPADAYPNLLAELKEIGVTIRSNGYFDFDGDEVKETWVTIRHRSAERLELWILRR